MKESTKQFLTMLISFVIALVLIEIIIGFISTWSLVIMIAVGISFVCGMIFESIFMLLRKKYKTKTK